MNLYFECKSGISGDMSVGALLDLGASREKLDKALESMKLENEFIYEVSKKSVNTIMATDFNVKLPNGKSPEDYHHNHDKCHHIHKHRNLDDVNRIIDRSDTTENTKKLAKKIFKIVAKAEAKIHGKDLKDVHFHEVGAIDSIVDIISFAVLFDDLAPEKVYFSTIADGQGFVYCQHGKIPVPVPAVCEIAAEYKLPLEITDNNGEMVTPTGAAIVAALYTDEKLPEKIIIEKTGYGSGKRAYENPILRVLQIK